MDNRSQPVLAAAPGVLAFLLFLFYVLRTIFAARRATSHGRVPPEAAGAWPLIGHLPMLGGPQLPHVTLGAAADRHGPAFTIRLGVHRVLVVSSWEMAKECFLANDKAFINRPKSIAIELMSYNYAMFGFTLYGPYWREIRKITTLELLSNHRLAMLSHIRDSEVHSSIKSIHEQCLKMDGNSGTASVEMQRWFKEITANVIFRIVAGKRYAAVESVEGEKCLKAMKKFFDLASVFTVGDAIPFLRWADFGGYEKEMKRTAVELDGVVQGWLDEHKWKRSSGDGDSKPEDFIDVMLSVVDDIPREAMDFDSDTIIKSTCLALILGGSDTTTITLTWALSLLLNNRCALKRAQEELDTNVGRTRQVKESDIKNMPYLQAIIKETTRLYPAAQILPPRVAVEDCTVGGYHVRAGTRLFMNVWKMHRDSRVWTEPGEFRPERFLTTHKDVDLRGQHFELLPFGSGRRVCPGISFALHVTQYTLASLLHAFELSTPFDEAVDMSEIFGFTNSKATPLQVLLTPRLPSHLYP